MRLRLLALIVLAVFVVTASATASPVPRVADHAESPAAKKKKKKVKAKKKCVLKRKAKCRKANLKKRKIGKQNLAGADLKSANLAGAKLTGTNLAGADLSKANLTGAVLRNVDLRGADLRSANFTKATLVGVRFSSRSAPRAGWETQLHCLLSLGFFPNLGVIFANNATCAGADLRSVRFVGVSMINSDFRGVNLQSANLEDAYINGSRFDGANLYLASLYSSKMIDSSFTLANLASVRCTYCEVESSSFDQANMGGFNPAASVTKPTGAKANTYAGAVGLGPSQTVTLDGSLPTGATATVRATGDWLWSRACETLPCATSIPSGQSLVIEVKGATAQSSGGGITCTASGDDATCTGLPTAASTITLGAPLRTVTLRVDPDMSAVPTFDALVISTVSGGVATEAKRCENASSCATSVPSGTVVRVSGSISDGTHVALALCLGVTDWSQVETGSSPASPPSVVTCPDHTVTSDVSATFEGS